ncbi:MAG: hypothetical protein ACJASX_002443 [Limisphaerales bacterium]|jgi:hypothetical protein
MTDLHASHFPTDMKTKKSGARRQRILYTTPVQPPIARRILVMHARALTQLVRIQHRQFCPANRTGV